MRFRSPDRRGSDRPVPRRDRDAGYARRVRVEEPSDAADPRLADYRGVRDPEWLRHRRRFVVESRQVIELLLGRADLELESLLLTPAAHAALAPRLDEREDAVAYVVDPALLREIGGFAFHQGALAVVRRPEDERLDALLRGLDARARLVVLEDVTNPDNVGSIFRNALAFGAHGALLSSGCAHPFYRKSLRTSMGAALRLPFAIEGDWPGALAELRATGFLCAALTPERSAAPIERVAPALRAAPRAALVLGHEGDGLPASTQAACQLRARIPMAADVDSVNVATASGIALLAIAVIGGVVSAVYANALAAAGLSTETRPFGVLPEPGAAGQAILEGAFMSAYQVGLSVAAAWALLSAIMALVFLRARAPSSGA